MTKICKCCGSQAYQTPGAVYCISCGYICPSMTWANTGKALSKDILEKVIRDIDKLVLVPTTFLIPPNSRLNKLFP